jgi:hypothetical protein
MGLTILVAAPSSAVNGEATQAAEGEVARISIQVDAVEIAVFSEIKNLKTDAVVDGPQPPPKVVLERSFTEADEIFAWHKAIADGDLSARRDFVIVLYDAEGVVVGRYWVEDGWPTTLKLSTTGFTLDTVTFTGSRVDRID